jgi:hypothetical protein
MSDYEEPNDQYGHRLARLVPIVPISPIIPASSFVSPPYNPMTPEQTHDVAIRALAVRDRANSLATLSSVLSQNSGIACEWLRNRGQGEHNIEIEQAAAEGDTGLFSTHRVLRAKTTVKIS